MLSFAVNLLHRRRLLFLLLWALCLVAGLSLLPGLKFEFSLHPLLKGDNAQVASVKEFYRTFPPAEGHAVVTATWEDAVTINQLRQTAAWAKRLTALPEVRDVYSAASLLELNFQGFTLDEWARLGGTGDEPLRLGDGPGMRTIRGRFVSHDLRSLALHVRKDRGSYDAFLDALRRETAGWGHPVRILGTEVVLNDMVSILRRNLFEMLALQLVAQLIVLPLFFRSFRKAYLPLLTAMTGLLIYLAVLSAAGQSIGLIYLAGPLLIVVIGLSDSIHLQQQFDDARAQGLGVLDSLHLMFRNVGVACILTSLTTAIGFLSLHFAGHEEVRQFGFWCAVGVGTSFLAVMLFLPVALAFFPGDGSGGRWRTHLDHGRMRRFAVPTIVLLAGLSAGVAFVKVDSSISQELPKASPSVRDVAWFAQNFQGTDRLEIDVAGPLDHPELFAAVERLQHELGAVEGVVGSSSYADLIRFLLPADSVSTKDGPYLGLRAIGELDDFPQHLITRAGDRACIVFYTSNAFGSIQFRAFEKKFDEMSAALPARARFRLSGYGNMAYHSVNLITDTLFRSFGLSLVAITIVLAIALRSPLLAVLCLIPNALPILVAAGFAGWVDLPLRMGIVIVFTVGLGLAVDDTIHLIVRFRQLRRADPAASIRSHLAVALHSAGFAVVLTSVVLLVAASTFLKSDFSTMRDTGLILAIITASALLSDLLVLPWLIEQSARLHALIPAARASAQS